jgi:hypothetical protein
VKALPGRRDEPSLSLGSIVVEADRRESSAGLLEPCDQRLDLRSWRIAPREDEELGARLDRPAREAPWGGSAKTTSITASIRPPSRESSCLAR